MPVFTLANNNKINSTKEYFHWFIIIFNIILNIIFITYDYLMQSYNDLSYVINNSNVMSADR